MQTTGLNLADLDMSMEDVRKKAQPIKYLGKMLPISKSAFTYGAMLNADFAKEFDITVPKQATIPR
jgi:hypothetical protein